MRSFVLEVSFSTRKTNHNKSSLRLLNCCLDVLNTREFVSVRSQSAAFDFFKKLQQSCPVPIHVILGNHDMNLRHSRKISSLDGLAIHDYHTSNMLFLHRDIHMLDIIGKKCLLIPYVRIISQLIRVKLIHFTASQPRGNHC